ncbi:MAG: hypothetical protein KME43_02230 [Myxacorys chilensis ATA2-1-KO14]|nr:hypothetical protein [Myxacorys chilensis ATA2-1-KO14]
MQGKKGSRATLPNIADAPIADGKQLAIGVVKLRTVPSELRFALIAAQAGCDLHSLAKLIATHSPDRS